MPSFAAHTARALRHRSRSLVAIGVAGWALLFGAMGACDSDQGTRDAGAPDAAAPDVVSVCGNGVLEPGEECDQGSRNGTGTGCEKTCTWTCIPDTLNGDAHCDDHDACNGVEFCSPNHTCAKKSPPLADGAACGAGFVCQSQTCRTNACGNGIVAPPKECDLGAANGKGMGCDSNCRFDCVSNDPSRNCAPGDECATQGTCNDATHACTPGPALADGTPCGGSSGAVCQAGICTCTGTCHVVCGDGVRAGPEQCDDGNTVNLDGCDSNCMFEQEVRSTALQFSGTTDAFCTVNALGAQALTRAALGKTQSQIAHDVTAGVTNMILKFMASAPGSPVDLSGTSGNVVVGSLSATPQYGDGGAYNGNSDVDWWYTVDPDMIDGDRNPLTKMPGTFANKTLTAGPGRLTVKMNMFGTLALLDTWNARLQAAIGAVTAPKTSTGLPPGHLAAEHLNPAITSFENVGVGPSGPTAEMCGNVVVKSLTVVPAPATLITGGMTACDQGYTAANSLVDVFVGGCAYQGNPVINATQPDEQDPGVTFPPGTTPPFKLSASTSSHAVDTCLDSSASPQSVPIATCLVGLAYSNAFRFQSDRIIVK